MKEASVYMAIFVCLLIFVNQALTSSQVQNNIYLLYSTKIDIRISTNLHNRNSKIKTNIVVSNLTHGAAIDYHYESKKICWTDHGQEVIQCVQYNGTEAENKVDVIINDVPSPDGLACDWFTNKLYWTDSETSRIEVATMEGHYRKRLFWTDIDQPRAIALVPMKGLLFWTDWGEVPKIERAGMNGDPSTRKVIVSENIVWPNGLTVDYESELVYWIDGSKLFIDVMNFDGKNRTTVLKSGFEYPFALTHIYTKLYWTDWKTWSIHYYDSNSTQSPKELIHFRGTSVPMDIHVWDPRKQPKMPHPCEHNNGGCSHLCLLAPYSPGYSCACPIGIKLITNITCADGPQKLLLLARKTDICIIYLDSPDYSHSVIPLHSVKYAIAVEYDPIQEFIYWSDEESKKIQRARLNGSDQQDVVSVDIQNPHGITIDWLSRNLYWTDSGTDRIEVVRIDKGYRRVIISTGLIEPRAIAIAPKLGWLFWSDWSEKRPKIEKSNSDGSDREIIVSDDLGWPNGITLDLERMKIYWCDAKLDRIEYADMDGKDRRVLLNDNVPHVFGFSLMEDFLYWTDWQRNAVDRAHKGTGAQREIIADQIANVMGLKAINLRPVNGANSCTFNNGNCSQLCFHFQNGTRTCSCEIEYDLADDGRSCIKPNATLLFARRDVIGKISIEQENHEVTVLPISGLKHTSSIDFDVDTDRIYWSDIKLNKIIRSYFNGSDPQKVVEFGLVSPEDIAVDWLGHNIYWTDAVAHRIEVARLSGTSRRTLLWGEIHEPHSIVLDPVSGYMYWSEWGTSNIIKKAAMDGSNQRELIQTNGHANGLTLDYGRRRLYWTEIDHSLISSSDLNGNDKTVLIRDIRPLALSLFNDYIYWSDEKSAEIWRANKFDGHNRVKVRSLPESATDILIYHPPKQEGFNQCSNNNGGCNHLCLAVPDPNPKQFASFTCACPTHYTLIGNRCIPPSEFILYSQKNSQKALAVRLIPDTSDCPEVVLPVQGLKNVRAIDYDPVNNHLYWIDGKAHSIKRADVNGESQVSVIVSGKGKDDSHPFDLVIDTIGRLLFWTCASKNIINVTRLDNSIPFGVAVQRDDEQPRLLAIHPTKRLLFYTDVGKNNQLIRTRLDGSHRIVISTVAKKDGNIEAIAVDAENDLIVWAQSHCIYISNIDGENMHGLLDESRSRITQLTIHKGWLYWIDRELNQLQRLELLSGKSRSTLPIQASNIVDLISVVKPGKDNPCASKPQNCSHFCILNGTSPVCACLKGKVLQEDKRTCIISPSCGQDHFTCVIATDDTKDCIPLSWRCDGQRDCFDGMDEIDCTTCRVDQFKCHNGQCLDQVYVCDGTPQCQDKSDEANCCKNSFQCPHVDVCVPFSQVCDGIEHCADGADENQSLCNINNIKKSYPSEILIVTGIIIFLIWVTCSVYFVHKRMTKNEIIQEQTEDLLTPVPNNPQVAKAHPTRKGIPDLVRMSMLTGQSSSYDRGNITGASSSTTNGSSGICYPCETLNPPPSPATTRGSSSCSHYRPYRHYRSINQPPPPTPCSTDVCDESDCNYPNYPMLRSRYDAGPFPPPPTPRSHCYSESCPPSPSSRASTYFSPLPPPPSPVPSPPRGYDS